MHVSLSLMPSQETKTVVEVIGVVSAWPIAEARRRTCVAPSRAPSASDGLRRRRAHRVRSSDLCSAFSRAKHARNRPKEVWRRAVVQVKRSTERATSIDCSKHGRRRVGRGPRHR